MTESSIRKAARALVDHLKSREQEVLQDTFEEPPVTRRFVLVIDRQTWDLIVDLDRAIDSQPHDKRN